ncbi:ligase-associated DNA damage response DEXH box helicase [Parafilimonas sp.]|uniref:ligase-associated DNA damage response DEXH box helicase n=1 Tax=Parafilimonas sp. TaxID=1969739 RepID=UPI003F823D8F
MKLKNTKGYSVIQQWLASKNMQAFRFQEETWQHIINNKSGLVNAPTGCGKTFSVFLGSLIQFINNNPDNYQKEKNNGLQLLWITPLRALAKDIGRAMEEVIEALGMQWQIGIRNGDTDINERQRQTRNTPEVLIITPESLMLLLAQKNYPNFFKSLHIIAVDEWHELLGSKRGVQVELAISRILAVSGKLQAASEEKPAGVKRQKLAAHSTQLTASVWGISATIGNLDEAREVLLSSLNSPLYRNEVGGEVVVKARMDKRIEVISVLPDEIEKYPWAGHLGIKLAEKVVPIVEQSNTTLIFINTRSMSELWYQTLLTIAPQFAGVMALHHGSIEHELRIWVEEALHAQKLKAVVCTASLDLGVDFRPVDTVIQVGSPKGVARFLQRAGRSGHAPGDISKVYFLPTHSLELVEAAALKSAIHEQVIESRQPMLLCFDVLMQYLCTLAIGEGFRQEEILEEIKGTYCFRDITAEEWNEILQQITDGGRALENYDEYKKVEIDEKGLYRIRNRRIAMRHRMQIGTIVSDAMMKVRMMNGSYIGMIEEWFLSRLEPGDAFTFAGRNLELVMIKEMTAHVKISPKKKSIIPSWMGGRMSLTANLGMLLRRTFNKALKPDSPELKALQPLFKLQQHLSHIPQSDELLIEQIESKDGFHLLVYPFEGRQIHEAMSSILAWRISQITPITFSIAMNDYGFELLSDQPVPVDDTNVRELFTTNDLIADIQRSVNSVEMASRKFRDIAVIGGLIFTGYPGEPKKAKHLQASASLLFRVFSEYDPNNILLKQAYHEVFEQQMEEVRLRTALERIQQNEIVLKFPQRFTPLSFPIIVDGLSRYNLSSEKFEDRIRKMQNHLE